MFAYTTEPFLSSQVSEYEKIQPQEIPDFIPIYYCRQKHPWNVFCKFHMKTPVLDSLFNKVAGLQLLQKETLTQVFQTFFKLKTSLIRKISHANHILPRRFQGAFWHFNMDF